MPLNKNEQKKIEKLSNEFFEKFCPEEKIDNFKTEDNTVCFEIISKTPEILIGRQGRILLSLQHILGRILRKQVKEDIFVNIDINQYKKKKIDYLKDLAKATADQVSIEKKEKALFPMSSFERRIIHLALGDRKDVITEAVGEEPDRRVVVKPAQ